MTSTEPWTEDRRTLQETAGPVLFGMEREEPDSGLRKMVGTKWEMGNLLWFGQW